MSLLIKSMCWIVLAFQTEPATQPVSIDPAAQTILDELRHAYAKLTSLELAGTYRLQLDAAAQKQDKQAQFTASFLAPNRFRHELTDDALVVSNGRRAYLYMASVNRFNESDIPQSRPPLNELPESISTILGAQNPSLRAAICQDATAALLQEADSVARLPDERIDAIDCQVLRINAGKKRIDLLIDPRTHLLRRVRWDLSDHLVSQLFDVKRAMLTVDYTTSNPNAPIAEATFAWTIPPGAREARPPVASASGGEAEAMIGKRAANSTLKDLDDTPVSLASMRGSVVVLDFWATWCGPCREALPHLNKLHNDLAEKGVKVLAVNLREDPQTARKFVEDNSFTFRVVLDTDGKVAEKYAVRGIPQTVVIDKNGVIRNVLVGFGPDSAERLRHAVEQVNKTD